MRTVLAASLIGVVLAAGGCAAFGGERSGIVVTTNILGDITQHIVGDETDVHVLMKPDADPHSFGVSAQDAARMESAELIVHNGLGLEEGIARNVDAAEEAGVPTLAVGEHADPIDYSDGEADPHFWTDPVRVADAAETLTDRIAESGEVDEDTVRANAEDYLAELDVLHEDMQTDFAALPDDDRVLVTNHHVFGYLAQRYDFEVLGAVIPSGTTLASPSGSDLKSLADAIEEADVGAIFVDSAQPDRLAQALADEVGIEVAVESLYSESLTGPDGGAPTYMDMMRANTDVITAGLAE